MSKTDPYSLHPFDQAIRVTLNSNGSIDSDRPTVFEVSLDEGWWIQRGPNGGYVAAVMLEAMQQVAGARPPRSLTVQYPKPPSAGHALIEVTPIRAGKSVTFLSARLLQEGATIITALGVFGDRRDTVIEFDGKAAKMPEVEMPKELHQIGPGENIPPVISNFDFSLAIGPRPLSGDAGEAETGGWIRPHLPRMLDAQLATSILDVWVPAPFTKLDAPQPAPTLDFTVHFRAELPIAQAQPTDPYLLHVHSDLSRDGYFEEDAALWHPSGTLVAHSRQLALI